MATKKTETTTKKRTRKAPAASPVRQDEARQDGVMASTNGIEEAIRRRAYELYLERGGMPGNPNEDWLVAEQEVRSRHVH